MSARSDRNTDRGTPAFLDGGEAFDTFDDAQPTELDRGARPGKRWSPPPPPQRVEIDDEGPCTLHDGAMP